MLTPDYLRHRLRGSVTVAVVTAAMLLPASATMAMDAGSAELEPAIVDPADAQATANELRTLVDDLNLANDALESDNATLRQTVDAITRQRDRLRTSLTASMTCTTRWRPIASCSSSCARACPRRAAKPKPSSTASGRSRLASTPPAWVDSSIASPIPRPPSWTGASASSPPARGLSAYITAAPTPSTASCRSCATPCSCQSPIARWAAHHHRPGPLGAANPRFATRQGER